MKIAVKKKLLVISNSSVLSVNRGPYRKLSNFYDITIVTTLSYVHSGRVGIYEHEESGLFSLKALKKIGFGSRFYYFHNLKKEYGFFKPDFIILEADPISLVFLYTALNFRKVRIGLITYENFHSKYIKNSYFKYLKQLIRNLLINYVFMCVKYFIDVLFVVNNDALHLYKKLGHSNVVLMPLGVDLSIFKFDPTTTNVRNSDSGKKLRIGYFGRIVPEKGLHILLDALAILEDKNWNLMLDLEGPTTEYIEKILEKISKLGFCNQISYVSPKHSEVPEFLLSCDVIIVPSISSCSWSEQYGRIAAESIAMNRMVIASSCGHLPDLIGDAGLIFKEEDTFGLSKLIASIQNDREILVKYAKLANKRKIEISTDEQALIMHNAIHPK